MLVRRSGASFRSHQEEIKEFGYPLHDDTRKAERGEIFNEHCIFVWVGNHLLDEYMISTFLRFNFIGFVLEMQSPDYIGK